MSGRIGMVPRSGSPRAAGMSPGLSLGAASAGWTANAAIAQAQRRVARPPAYVV